MNKLLRLVLAICFSLTAEGLLAQPTADFTATPLAGCAPHVVYFTNTSTGNPTSYLWDFGNGFTSVLQNPSTTYLTAGSYTVTLTVTNASGSNTKTMTSYITVYPNPTVAFTVSDTTSCPPLAVQFTDNSNPNIAGNATYHWSFGDGTPFSALQNPAHSYPNSGNYTVALTVTNSTGCATTLTKQNYIEVYTPPVADFTANPSSFCTVPATINFTPTVTGTGPYTYAWDFGDGTIGTGNAPSHVYTTPGIYTVSVIATDANGCKDTAIKNNYLNIGIIAANYTASPSSACVFTSVQFTNASVGGTSVLWDFGDGDTAMSQNPTHTFSTSGTFDVTLVIFDGGCSDTIVMPYTVHPQPVADFTFSPLHPCPAPSTLQFTNNTTGAINYYWSFGDGGTSNATSPSYSYTNNNEYTVQLIAVTSFGCSDTVSKKDTVHNMYFIWQPPYATGCVPLDVHFDVPLFTTTPDPNLPHPYPYGIASYHWDFGDGTSSNLDTPNHTYTTQGVYTVTYTVTTVNGCTWTDSTTVTAGNLPVASFINYPDTVCVNQAVTLINTSTNIDTNITTFRWFWGNTQPPETAGFTGTYQYNTSGTYDVTLEANTYGCLDTFAVTQAVVVNPPTSIWNEFYSCDTPLMVRFIDTNSINPTSLIWFFGDGTSTTSSDPVHTYPALGSYTVSLVTFNSTYGCSDTATKTIRLLDPVLTFSTPDTAICRADSIVFTPNYTDIPSPYVWQLNYSFPPWPYNPLYNPNPSVSQWGYRFNQNGIYTVGVKTYDIHGCLDSATRVGYVLVAKPTAAFTGTPLIGCTPLNVTFTEASSNTPGAFSVTREWDFGNGLDTVTTASTNNIYNAAGLYTVKLIVTDNVGCKDTLEKQDYVDTRHTVANFAASTVNGCIGAPITFTNGSTGTALTASWDFGDGTASTTFAPSKTYNQTGTYTVTLVVSDPIGCADTMVKTAYINISKPTASFTMSDTMAICPPLNVSLNNNSTGALTYAWDFGNGSTSIAQNPTATYPNPGIFPVMLIATNAYGCKDTAYGQANVLGYAGGLTYTPIAGCSPLTVQFTANLTNVPSIIWDFSDGVTMPLSGSNTITHTYANPGAYMPKLILSDNSGCQNSSLGLDTIKVDDVIAGFITSPPCINTPVTFNDTSFSYFSPVTQWSWDFNNGQQTNNVHNPIMNYSTPGTYPVTLVAVNARGCKDSISRTVTIYDLPVIGAGEDTTICNGDPAVITGIGGVSYTWAPAGSLSCANCQTTNATPSVTTDYVVTGTDQNGCENKDTVQVLVQYVTSSAVGDGGNVCIDSVFQLHAFGAERYEWDPASTLNTYNIPDPLASPKETTVYTVLAWEGSCPPDAHTVEVVVLPKPVVDAGSDVAIVAGSSTMLQAIGTDISTFEWSPTATLSCETCSNPTASPKVTTMYKVIAATEYGCKSYDTVTVRIVCDKSQLFIPNTFTPNNDGENDIFYPRGAGIKSISSFRVYNRWGELVFEKRGTQLNDPSGGWDGTYKGQLLNPDVFVWVIEGICDTGDPVNTKGDINLIR
jgi:gliding motility-associated-like protein